MFDDCKGNFRTWLIETSQLSDKAAGDVISRCSRLEKEVLDSIDFSVSSPQVYMDALKQIKNYAIKNKSTSKSQCNLARSYRAALKKYCQYCNPSTYEQYPNGFSIR